MDRDALVLYLENVRDLEVVKYKIQQLQNYCNIQYRKDINNHPTVVKQPEYKEIPLASPSITYALLGVVVTVLFVYMSLKPSSGWFETTCKLLVLFIPGIIAIVLYLLAISHLGDKKEIIEHNNSEKRRYLMDTEIAKNNLAFIEQRKEEWNKKTDFYERQSHQVEELLRKYYSMNIIPKTYLDSTNDRNRPLATACYLYDYMSSSRESFQMALISNQIEDGIQRIEAKLDIIIDRLDTIIWNQKVMREENRRYINQQIDQNNRMLSSLKQIERNQQSIEDYSRLSAYYNEAQAFFGMATYLKNVSVK